MDKFFIGKYFHLQLLLTCCGFHELKVEGKL